MISIKHSAATVAVLAVGLSACGNSETDDAGAVRTVTVVEKAVEERTAPARDVAKPAEKQVRDAPEAVAAETSSGGIRVPDVVGTDHQLAQDTMQAAGLYNLSEEDATGQGRALMWDRNWVVVAQHPAAGAKVTEDATITLRSKKDGE
jgi:ABC-type glycerol-3-phosphate transport system substrate-binding protein